MRACAECIPACASACACACARARVRARARDGDPHQGITVHMYIIIGTRARMYTGMRALAECIPACVGGRRRARARRERASTTNCVSLRTFYIDGYLYMNVGTYGCIIARFCMCVCVCEVYIYRYVSVYNAKVHIYMYIHIYVCVCMYIYI